MGSERLWIVILALVCFLTGTAAGLLVAPRFITPEAPGPFAQYQARMAEEFDLTKKQRTALRSVMEEYGSRMRDIEARYIRETARERAKLGRECRNTILKHVLDAQDQDRFVAMADGRWPLTAESPATQ